MQKMNGSSLDLTKYNIEKLKEIFPEVFEEGKIDFDKLRLILGDNVEDKEERYEFNWHGKRDAMRLAQTPSMGTLRPDKESSKNWDTTENLYIEGDNLEVLKLLQKSYFGKVKMIYIDPPYNTGNDFVYPDDFRDNIANYKDITSQTTKSNLETNGRYHTDWLNMMYPRLKLARNLLSEEGIIFISIDDNEVENLKKICNEIFGEENFIEQIIWKNKYGSGAKTKGFISVHEYILCYSKSNINNLTSDLSEEERKKYIKKDDKYEKYGGYRTQPLMTKSLGDRPNLVYPIIYKGNEIWPNKQWVWSKERMENAIKNNEVEIREKSDGTYTVEAKKYLKDEFGNSRRGKPSSILNSPFTQEGTLEIKQLFNDKTPFEFTKPSNLIKYLISLEINDNDDKDFITLDFFSGSATTAHSVMKLNLEDKGKRKFIMVQVPEKTYEKSQAFKLGYSNICEIGKERIRRAGDKIVSENKDKEGIENLDIGFKVFKLDSSNLKSWDSSMDNLEQNLLDMVSNLKQDRTNEDLLYEILLKSGVELTAKIEEIKVGYNTLYNVGCGALLVCLDDKITQDVIDEIPKHKSPFMDTKVIFKEAGFMSDAAKINAVQNLKQFKIEDVRSV